MDKRSWFVVLFLILLIAIRLVNDIVVRYQEINSSSHLLGILFLGSILGLFSVFLLAVYRYVKEILTLENSGKLKQELKEAIEKKDKVLVRKVIFRFISFCENFYNKKHEVYPLKRELKSYDLSIDEMLKLLHRLEERVLLSKDKEAEKIVKNVAIQTALSTGISPVALVDALIMFWRSWFLVREIAKIYGFRPNLVNTMSLFKKSMYNMTISASLELVDDVFAEASEIEISPVLEKLGKSLAQAFANGMLVLRFGYNVIEACRPIPIEEEKEISNKGVLQIISKKVYRLSVKKNREHIL